MTGQNEIVGVEYNQSQFKKAKFMPKYHQHKKVGDGKYTVAIKPMGGRIFFRFWPYFNGSDVNLVIFVKNTSQEACQLSYQYFLYRCNEPEDKVVDTKDVMFGLEPKENNKKKISKHLIVLGEYYAKLDLSESGENLVKGLPVASFKLLSNDVWTANLLFLGINVIVSAIIAALASWLFWSVAGIR